MNTIIGHSPIYDTVEGINSFVSTGLKGLHELKDLRHEAGYSRKERLNEFVVLGRFRLDTCGNFDIPLKDSGGIIPAEYIRNIPAVLTYNACRNYLPENASICTTGYSLPPTYVKCEICDDSFNIKNCHDVISINNSEHFSLDNYVGQKLSNIKQIRSLVNRVKHYVSNDIIGSDNYINKDGGNEKGWKNISKDYIIQLGDKASVSTYKFYHSECNRLNIIETSLDKWKKIFKEVAIDKDGFNLKYTINGTPNQHCPCESCPPWYIVRIEGIAPIIIGWRKSVINIYWEKSGINLSHLFENEDVTKDNFLIHAHGYDKAVEYLNKIIPALLTNIK